jgi:hypothetical protein
VGIFHFKENEIPISFHIFGDDFDISCGYAWSDRKMDMELDMNLYDELVQEVIRKEFLEKINTLGLQREAVNGKTLFDRGFTLIYRWSIFLGVQLHQRFQDIAPGSFHISRQKS